MKKSLLVNFNYFAPVGHAVEALRHTLGYHKANPDYEISLILNKHTPYFLANLCPWIKKIYTVDLPWDTPKDKVNQKLIAHIPKTWDFIASDARSETIDFCPEPFFAYYQLANKHFKARIKEDFCGGKLIPYAPNEPLAFKLPQENHEFARKHLLKTEVKIGLMFAGHGEQEYNPPIKAWEKIIEALFQQYPDLSIYLFGRIKRDDKGTVTAGIGEQDIKRLLNKYSNCVNCFDTGLLNQLAVVEQCDVFISPHTGFAFAVLCVGTPWLTISGTEWSEYFYNSVPFYSVLPKCSKYPCYRGMLKKCQNSLKNEKRVLCMTEDRIKNDLPEILKGADILINKKWDFQTCMKAHIAKVTKLYGKAEWLYSFDNIHEQVSTTSRKNSEV